MLFADLHSDTPFELYKTNQKLKKNNLHISLENASAFQKYIQVADIWSDKLKTDDECYNDFFKIADYFKSEAGSMLCMLGCDIASYERNRFILAVEDARLLSGNIERLNSLYNAGVRIMTLLWSGLSCIGGAWDTKYGLTDFGRKVVASSFEIGIVPDVSHASRAVIEEVCEISKHYGKPIIATHSNSYTVNNHMRNLTDEHFHLISDFGGIIGISLCPEHLSSEKNSNMNDIINHIDHYISISGTESVCFGCDFDGITALPNGIKNISSIEKLYYKASEKFGFDTADKIFYYNAYNFLLNNI